ncbi:MAG: GLPGLI family protein, partial [Cruoricaptor ignavus]|nr:GLPGLI family protein [Cruoricaptor ignavus]
QDEAGKRYQYEEKPIIFDWQLQKGEKEILGYQCQKATTKYRGRTYTAWFSKDLPFSNGPYVFDGLPGLILEITSNDGEYHFTAIAIDKNPKEIYLRNEKDILEISRDKFMEVKRNYHENPGFYFQGTAFNSDGSELKSNPIPYNPIELEN